MGSNLDPTTAILVALLVIATLLAVAVSSPLWAFAAIIGAAFLTIAVSAIRNPVLFKIGARSLVRRKGMSLIVVAGLMIGTVIISSSLVIGDTMDTMITRAYYETLHEVDEIVYADGLEEEKALLDRSDLDPILSGIRDIDHVEAVTVILETTVFVIDETSGQTEPGILLIGYETSSIEFGGFQADGKDLPMEPAKGSVYIDERTANALDASIGDTLTIPIGEGIAQVIVGEIVDHEGRAIWTGKCIFMPLEEVQSLLGLTDVVNTILITNDGDVKGGEKHCISIVPRIEEMLEGNDQGLELKMDKHSSVEEGKKEMEQFSQMFLVFGSFSVIAGIILIINIFVMLGEERKGEMGISRAVGMTRSDLKRSFVYEGALYSVVSSLVGAGLGVGVAYLVLLGMNNIFGMWFQEANLISSFSFESASLVHSFAFGVLISLVTVSFAASRINKLNIVRAIRNIPEPSISKSSGRVFILGIGLTLLGAVFAASGFLLFADMGLENFQLAGIYTGASLLLIGAALLARRAVGDRIAFSTASVLIIVFWLVPAKIMGLDGYGGDIEMFILSGLFAVSAGIMLFINNSIQIVSWISSLWAMTGRPTATMKTASSYPMKNRFRTGMTIYMFALIIFTITVMSMMVGVLSVNIERITREQMGEIEIVGLASAHQRIDEVDISIGQSSNLSPDDFDQVYSIVSGNVVLDSMRPAEGANVTIPYALYGVGPDISSAGWSFMERMEGFSTDQEVWDALQSDDSLAVIDASVTQTSEDWGAIAPGFSLNAGDILLIVTPEGVREKTVAAVMEQNLIQGVFVSKGSAASQFNLTANNVFLFDLSDGVDGTEVAKVLERDLGLQTIVLSEQVEMVTRSMEMMFGLFSAFMGLGLVVGIAGLGIITLRAVHERRAEIGMMRAIGFQRLGVTWSFLMEAGFIATAGIVLGSVLGIALGYTLWYDEFRPMDFDFYIPWMKIVLVGAFSLLVTLVFTVPPSYSASTVAPAEALRYD